MLANRGRRTQHSITYPLSSHLVYFFFSSVSLISFIRSLFISTRIFGYIVCGPASMSRPYNSQSPYPGQGHSAAPPYPASSPHQQYQAYNPPAALRPGTSPSPSPYQPPSSQQQPPYGSYPAYNPPSQSYSRPPPPPPQPYGSPAPQPYGQQPYQPSQPQSSYVHWHHPLFISAQKQFSGLTSNSNLLGAATQSLSTPGGRRWSGVWTRSPEWTSWWLSTCNTA